MKTSDFLRKHNAYRDCAKWALSISDDMAYVWDALVCHGKHEWLLWTATRPVLFPDSVMRKLACRFVRETPIGGGKTVWDLLTDEMSRKAIEVADRYADGNATTDELVAAYDAARPVADAARAAASAAEAAAAWAERAAYFAAVAASDAAYSAVYAADSARSAACAAEAAASWAADAAVFFSASAAYSACAAAKSAQVQMIAQMGNPFKTKGD